MRPVPLLLSKCHVVIQVRVYRYPRKRFRRCLLLRLRQGNLDGVRDYYGRGNHEEDQQEEYDVGHRGHAERFVYLCSSFRAIIFYN